MKLLTYYISILCVCILYEFCFNVYNSTLNVITYFVTITIFADLIYENLSVGRKNYHDDYIINKKI